MNSPNILSENNLRAAVPSISFAIRCQSPGAEIPFLRAKIPFSTPPIARIPPNERAPAKFLWCPGTPHPASGLPSQSSIQSAGGCVVLSRTAGISPERRKDASAVLDRGTRPLVGDENAPAAPPTRGGATLGRVETTFSTDC